MAQIKNKQDLRTVQWSKLQTWGGKSGDIPAMFVASNSVQPEKAAIGFQRLRETAVDPDHGINECTPLVVPMLLHMAFGQKCRYPAHCLRVAASIVAETADWAAEDEHALLYARQLEENSGSVESELLMSAEQGSSTIQSTIPYFVYQIKRLREALGKPVPHPFDAIASSQIRGNFAQNLRSSLCHYFSMQRGFPEWMVIRDLANRDEPDSLTYSAKLACLRATELGDLEEHHEVLDLFAEQLLANIEHINQSMKSRLPDQGGLLEYESPWFEGWPHEVAVRYIRGRNFEHPKYLELARKVAEFDSPESFETGAKVLLDGADKLPERNRLAVYKAVLEEVSSDPEFWTTPYNWYAETIRVLNLNHRDELLGWSTQQPGRP